LVYLSAYQWEWRQSASVEGHRISVDTIEVHGEPLSTKNAWAERRLAIERVEVIEDFASLDEARLRRGVTLALLRPSKLVRLQMSQTGSPDWTDEEVAKLMQSQTQGG